MYSFTVRFVAITAILFNAIAPSVVQGQVLSTYPGSGLTLPGPLVRIAETQAAAYTVLGWPEYQFCNDFILQVDQEIRESPTADRYTARRSDGHPFTFTVEHRAPIDDWANADLPEDTKSALREARASAAVVLGVLEGTIEYTAVTFSFQYGPQQLLSFHGFILIDWQPIVEQVEEYCPPDNRNQYVLCRLGAYEDYHDCIAGANNDFDHCLWVNTGIVAGMGAFLGCLSGVLASTTPLGAINLKAALVGCGIGVIGFTIGSIMACVSAHRSAKSSCERELNRALRECRREHCGY